MNQIQPNPSNQEEEFNGIKRLLTAAQICAIVSLIIGGFLLSAVGLAIAFIARNKLNNMLAQTGENQDEYKQSLVALQRTNIIAIGIAAVACVINIIFAIQMYPIIYQMLQTGDFSSIYGGVGQTPSPNSSGSIWG